jgi:hypothetical protein
VSIAHDLSSEIAIAILTTKEQSGDLNDLKEVVLRVHDVLLEANTAMLRAANHRRLLRKKELSTGASAH